jgi:hypothetical protein
VTGAPGHDGAGEAGRGVSARILTALAESPRPAMFVTELALAASPGDGESFGAALAQLRRQGQVLLADHPPPDRHLTGSDLRIVAGPLDTVPRATAEQEAEMLWREWLTEFTSTHRCG